MRFTEKLTLPGKSSSSSKISGILPGRLSVDGSDFYRKNYELESDSFTDTFDLDSKSSKMDSTTTGKSSTSSRSACGRQFKRWCWWLSVLISRHRRDDADKVPSASWEEQSTLKKGRTVDSEELLNREDFEAGDHAEGKQKN
jgi:hypothetical protein